MTVHTDSTGQMWSCVEYSFTFTYTHCGVCNNILIWVHVLQNYLIQLQYLLNFNKKINKNWQLKKFVWSPVLNDLFTVEQQQAS